MKRMIFSALALIGVFVALYLTMYKTGSIGTLSCGTGGCERVNTSEWADFFGVPTAIWGLAFYLATFGAGFAGTFPRLEARRDLSLLLVAMCGVGVLFSAYLTYLELFVIHAICRYCVASAIIVTLMFIVSWLDLRDHPAVTRVTTRA